VRASTDAPANRPSAARTAAATVTASSASPINAVHATLQAAVVGAACERSRPGPSHLTTQIAANHPATLATASGRAASSAAFDEIPNGPIPFAVRSVASVRRRSSQ
jgi:hypothetical protein